MTTAIRQWFRTHRYRVAIRELTALSSIDSAADPGGIPTDIEIEVRNAAGKTSIAIRRVAWEIGRSSNQISGGRPHGVFPAISLISTTAKVSRGTLALRALAGFCR